tara:strand:- start:158 stop:511 length:354 start_codon:yes stop_codon:yes gene_type:complete
MDLDHCGAMLKMLQGFSVDEESFGRDAYLETGPGENFLSTAHTLDHFATANFQPSIPEPGPYETWMENGHLTADQRATGIWQQMLADYREPSMQQSHRDALAEFMAERKASMPDKWY